jgi:hypothetical protein
MPKPKQISYDLAAYFKVCGANHENLHTRPKFADAAVVSRAILDQNPDVENGPATRLAETFRDYPL